MSFSLEEQEKFRANLQKFDPQSFGVNAMFMDDDFELPLLGDFDEVNEIFGAIIPDDFAEKIENGRSNDYETSYLKMFKERGRLNRYRYT